MFQQTPIFISLVIIFFSANGTSITNCHCSLPEPAAFSVSKRQQLKVKTFQRTQDRQKKVVLQILC